MVHLSTHSSPRVKTQDAREMDEMRLAKQEVGWGAKSLNKTRGPPVVSMMKCKGS